MILVIIPGRSKAIFLSRAVADSRARQEDISDALLAHMAPLGWEHISFNGDYIWPTRPLASCAGARFYMEHCGLSGLDGNHDGIPCNSLYQ